MPGLIIGHNIQSISRLEGVLVSLTSKQVEEVRRGKLAEATAKVTEIKYTSMQIVTENMGYFQLTLACDFKDNNR